MTTTLDAPFDEVIDEVSLALEQEGFGILSDIDVETTLKEKLNVDVDRYRILGACNPALAHRGLTEEPALGTLLPCNVVVYEANDEVVLSAVDPDQLLAVKEHPELEEIATTVRERFQRVLTGVDAQFPSGGAGR